jgi:peptidoglycan hydrolase-like protein with peptidoglycan-binding domain
MSPLIIAAVAAGAYLVFFRKKSPSSGGGPSPGGAPGVLPVSYNVPQSGDLTVLETQQALNMLGFGSLTEDGIYGPQTAAAIRAFQTQAGVAVDGVVGPQTSAAIHTAMADIGLSLGDGGQATTGPRFDPRQTPWYAHHHQY